MALKKHLMVCVAAVLLTSSIALPAASAPWRRGFVVGTYEYAFRYGGPRGGEADPGLDCPHGSTNSYASPDQIKKVLERQKWRSQQEIDWIAHPPRLDEARNPTDARRGIWARAISYRGYKRGIETYINPWAADDTGQPEVMSRIAEGFNLDGKIGPHDFVSPYGEKGIDNAFYRAWGCDTPLRGDGNARHGLFANDKMRAGLYTVVIRISGDQDPMNDSDATLEIGYSPDKIAKDARGGVAMDYSFRILTSAQYTKLKAKIKNGVVEAEQVEHLHTPRIASFYDQIGDTNFTKGKIRLNIAPDGLSGTGLIGGYRSWRNVYAESITSFFSSAGANDVTNHEDHVALYYALRRNADGMYNEKTDQYDGISTVYRIKFYSAFVMDSHEPIDIPTLVEDPKSLRMRKVAKYVTAGIIKGIETRIPQDVPPSSGEAYYPFLEQRSFKGYPNRDYFLNTLDRPHYPDGVNIDEDNFATDDQGNPIGKRRNTLDEQDNR